MQDILVFGAGGHAKVVIDALEKTKAFRIQAIIARQQTPTPHSRYPIVDESSDWGALGIRQGVVALGDNWMRKELVENIRKKFPDFVFPSIIHPSSVIGYGVQIGAGSVVIAGAVINPDTSIGNHCIINTRSSVDHDCQISDFASIAPGVSLGGEVKIGMLSSIGIGATVRNGVTVGQNTVVGAGATVVKDLPELVVAYGTPCKAMRSRNPWDKYLSAASKGAK